MKRLLFVFASLASLAGCANSEFSCPGRPTGVTCLSAIEVFEATNTRDRVTSADAAQINGETTVARQRLATQEVVTPEVATSREQLHPRYEPPPYQPVPVRTPPVVVRLLLSSWEDRDGDLQAGGYVFTELEPRTWSIGEAPAGTRSDVVLQPIIGNSPRN